MHLFESQVMSHAQHTSFSYISFFTFTIFWVPWDIHNIVIRFSYFSFISLMKTFLPLRSWTSLKLSTIGCPVLSSISRRDSSCDEKKLRNSMNILVVVFHPYKVLSDWDGSQPIDPCNDLKAARSGEGSRVGCVLLRLNWINNQASEATFKTNGVSIF